MNETLLLLITWLLCLGTSIALYAWQRRTPRWRTPAMWAWIICLSLPVPLLKIDTIVPGGALLLTPLLADHWFGFALLALLALLGWSLVYAIVRIVGRRFGSWPVPDRQKKPAQ